jgi:hypothetical protein
VSGIALGVVAVSAISRAVVVGAVSVASGSQAREFYLLGLALLAGVVTLSRRRIRARIEGSTLLSPVMQARLFFLAATLTCIGLTIGFATGSLHGDRGMAVVTGVGVAINGHLVARSFKFNPGQRAASPDDGSRGGSD